MSSSSSSSSSSNSSSSSSSSSSIQQGRAGRDGVAAEDAVRAKRRRYPPEGGELVPLVFETGGRPAAETVTYVRSLGASVGDPVERSMLTRALWQHYACTLQSGNAEMLLSAIG